MKRGQVFGLAKHVAAIAVITVAVFGNTRAADNSDVQEAMFFAARSEMGGSVLEPLIRKCNDLNDSEIPTGDKNVKFHIMERLVGNIGPVNYGRPVRTITTTSYGSVGRFEGTTAFGTHVSGDVMGSTTSVREKVGSYKASVPDGFKKAFEKMQSLARRKHPRACSETAACIFTEATKGQIGMSDRRAVDYFKKAAEGGDADGMFMYAFCLYHGIGCSVSKSKAYTVLLELKAVASKKDGRTQNACGALSGGWLARRMREAELTAK